MKRFLFCLLTLAPALAFGAATVDWISVESNGWVADVHVLGLSTNGTYTYGLGTSNSLTGNETLQFSVLSPGYDDSGASSNIPRTVVGTMRLRFAYPSQAFSYETLSGGNVTLRVALSDYIHSSDLITNVALAGGFYTQGGAPTAATNFTSCTNLSTVVPPRVIAMWSQPAFFLSGSNYNLSLVAFHYSAQQGRPVRAVQFWAVDSAGNRSPTNTVLTPSIDRTQPDAVPIVEYLTTIDGSKFAQGSTISNYAKVFPWWGKALDFSDNVSAPQNADYAPMVTFCDKSNIWPIVYATVDVANGVQAGRAVTNRDITTAMANSIPFTNIAQALNACAATNNAFNGSNTLENCVVLLTNGSYQVWGGTAVPDYNAPSTWTTIRARPDVNWSNVVLAVKNNSFTIQHNVKMRLYNVVLGVSANANTIDQGYGNVLIDQCQVWTNHNDVNLVTSYTNLFFRQSLITGQRNMCPPSSNQLNSWEKFRGCAFFTFDEADARLTTLGPVLAIGNAISSYTNVQYSFCNDTFVLCDPFICAFNRMFNGDESAYQVKIGINTNVTIGGAFVQNVVESMKSGLSIPLDVMQSQRANEWCTNVLIWNNTVVGKLHEPFNLGGFTTVSSDHYQEANNVFASREIKCDVSDSNSSATNRWSQLFSVGSHNNVSTQIGLSSGVTVGQNPAGNDLGFDGVSSYFNVLTNTIALNFTANGAWCGGNSNGFGDYHLLTKSPVVVPALAGTVMIPFDVEGNARGAFDPPGAYCSSSPRKGAAFLGF